MSAATHPLLFRKVFLVLWGGWTAIGLAGMLIPLPVVVVAWVIAGWVAMAAFELRFRARHLPPQARRPWHAILVIIPLSLAGLVTNAGFRYGHYPPGGSWSSRVYLVTLTSGIDRSPPFERSTFRLAVEARKANWGPRTTAITPRQITLTLESNPGATWMIDTAARTARRSGDSAVVVTLDQAGAERIVADLADRELTPEEREAVARRLRDVLSGALTPAGAPSVRRERTDRYLVNYTHGPSRISTLGQSAKTIGTVCFSLFLLPLTWFVVRFTMFPKAEE